MKDVVKKVAEFGFFDMFKMFLLKKCDTNGMN